MQNLSFVKKTDSSLTMRTNSKMDIS